MRLTALRTGEVDLIDNVAYADAPAFIKDHGKTYDTWPVPQVGTAFIAFNLKNGPFSAKDNPDAHLLRMAAAHAIDHEGIHEAVFNKQGEIAKGFYSEASPWHAQGHRSRGRSSIPTRPRRCARRPRAATRSSLIIANDSFPYMQQSGELVHAMLKDAGLQRDRSRSIPTPVMPGQVQQGHVRPRFVGQQLSHRPRRLVSRARSCRRRRRPCAGTATRTRRSTSSSSPRASRARQGQAPADVCRRRVADQPGPAAGLHALRAADAGRHQAH